MDFEGLIAVVDDLLENRRLLASIIRSNTSYQVVTSNDGVALLELLSKSDVPRPDLILLDVMMPVMNGFETARHIKENHEDIPIIFLTALNDIESKMKAFEMGGVDYISKPFNKNELLSRIKAQITLKKMADDLKMKNQMLEDEEKHLHYLVDQKTEKLEKLTLAMVTALENVNLFNDIDTGNHIRRVSRYAEFFAAEYGCSHDFVKRIKIYSSLHDIGKVGIPQDLLKKPGDYTSDEFEQIKKHVLIGAKMLEGEGIDPMARNIVLYHHERWDGKGYIEGLRGEEIPLEARIVALADVYDALTTKRVYKDIYGDNQADAMILSQKGKQFEPKLVEIYEKSRDRLLEVKKESYEAEEPFAGAGEG